ncbi:MAG: GxxExxY protein [Planctomycetales bacterium]|nr:GxxExxY protein [Planctomycetales bacterium]
MVISCPCAIRSLATAEFRELDYQIMNQAFATHRNLGRLADESIYQNLFSQQLRDVGFTNQRAVQIEVQYGSFRKHYYVDLIVQNRGIYEVKVASKLTVEHEMQLLNYLLLLDVERGKLINFRPQSVETRFVNAPARRCERQQFQIDDQRWTDHSNLRSIMTGALRDWGTGLSISLYLQAATHLLGGDQRVIRNIQMSRDGYVLGRQRFHMSSENEAFCITALNAGLDDYESNLSKLLRHSGLDAVNWINISLKKVCFVSVRQ